MRIIAGEFRGRRLLAPEGETTRPITDRAKQSLFDVLAPRVPGANVYDLFAGTGSLGLECLSRGAARVEFFEADRSAVARLRRNLEAVRISGARAAVRPGDLFGWFESSSAADPRVDLIFLDPPYRFLRERAAELRRLVERLAEAHLAANGQLIFRHHAQDQLDFAPLELCDQRDYGEMRICFLRLRRDPPVR